MFPTFTKSNIIRVHLDGNVFVNCLEGIDYQLEEAYICGVNLSPGWPRAWRWNTAMGGGVFAELMEISNNPLYSRTAYPVARGNGEGDRK